MFLHDLERLALCKPFRVAIPFKVGAMFLQNKFLLDEKNPRVAIPFKVGAMFLHDLEELAMHKPFRSQSPSKSGQCSFIVIIYWHIQTTVAIPFKVGAMFLQSISFFQERR